MDSDIRVEKKNPRSFAYSAQDLYNLEGAIKEVQGFEAFFFVSRQKAYLGLYVWYVPTNQFYYNLRYVSSTFPNTAACGEYSDLFIMEKN